MTCDQCGSRCQGSLCQMCEQIKINETLAGTPADDAGADSLQERDADSGDESDQEWSVDQLGLDGQTATGQTTLGGGVVFDGGESDD